jgi:putative NIF3 family GTP cyclohydrolase 1 type 2
MVWTVAGMEGLSLANVEDGMRRFWAAIFVLAIAGAAASGQEKKGMTAQGVVDAIKGHVGVEWREKTVDTFKTGDPNTVVTGVAVTMMATLDVLQRAVAAGDNMVITHEPIFFNHMLEQPEGMDKSDAVWTAKREFIEKNHLVIWKFHDHWHMRKPDGIQEGTVKKLGWEKYWKPEDQGVLVIPEMTVAELASYVAKRLDAPAVRVVGDPKMKVTKIGLNPGYTGFTRETKALERDDVEVLLAGESREWETVEYVADAVTEGKKKALIVIGHIPSEQAGMEWCAEWMRGFLAGVKIDFVAAKAGIWTVK